MCELRFNVTMYYVAAFGLNDESRLFRSLENIFGFVAPENYMMEGRQTSAGALILMNRKSVIPK